MSWRRCAATPLTEAMAKFYLSISSTLAPMSFFNKSLAGTGENWTLMKAFSVTEYLNYEAGKYSKSKGIEVFGNDAKDTNIHVEVWRYYLLTNRPQVFDTLFTWADLQVKLNSELLNNLGNFINRVLSFITKPPDLLAEKVGKYVEQYLEAMKKVKLKQGLKTAMSISSEGNAYLQFNNKSTCTEAELMRSELNESTSSVPL